MAKSYPFVISLFLISFLCGAQITYPVYLDGKSKESIENPNFMCFQSDVSKFIAHETDSDFVKTAMNPGDSIEFKISFVIGKDGFVIAARTKVETQYDFFNMYMSNIINRLPKFKPAHRKGLTFDYPVAFVPQFSVTSENRMQVLFDCEAQQEKVREATKELMKISMEMPKYTPIFPGCANRGSAEKCWECTQNRIREHIVNEFELPRGRGKETIGVITVQFTIDPDGRVSDSNWKVLRDAGYGTGYALFKAIRILPQMQNAVDETGTPVPATLTFSLNVH